MNLPKDPVMLLSVINTRLRDFYASFEELCDDLNYDGDEIRDKLAAINYHYSKTKNQFL